MDGRDAMVAVWKSDLVGSDIDPLHGVFRERAANRGLGALVSGVARRRGSGSKNLTLRFDDAHK